MSHYPRPGEGPFEGLPLFAREREIERAREARDDGMGRAEEHANQDLLARWWEALVAYLRAHETLHCDDFIAATPLRLPAQARALGPLYMKAARLRFMEKTGRSRPSVRSNLSEKPIWGSLIYVQG